MVLVIGIDGASPEVVERLTSRGRLPALRALMRHGTYGRLESSANCNPISAWASLLTGTNPGKHGAWDLFNLVPDSYEWQPAHAWLLRAPTIAQLLTERGLEVGTLFVPMTFPAREAEWTTVAGWLAPSLETPGFAYPARIAELAAEYLKDTAPAPEVRPHAEAGRYEAALELARDGVEAKCDLAERLLTDRQWDFLAVNFVETDRMQRWCWDLIDRAHPAYREEVSEAHAHCVEDLYAAVDAAVGRLSNCLGPSDQLMVVSTYGMALNNRAADCVPEVMERLGLVAKPTPAGGGWQKIKAGASRSMQSVCRAARRVLPGFLADRLPKERPGEAGPVRAGASAESTDHASSLAFPAAGGHVVLNLRDEFPEGAVSAEAEARLRGQIRSVLSSAIDPATGRRPLEWARSREEVCEGPHLDRIPHLVTRWRSVGVVSGLTVTGRDGQVWVAAPPGAAPSGAAAPEGILIAAGAGLNRGVRLEGARVEDVTATVLHLCRAPVPSYFDGRVLTAAIEPEYLAARPVRTAERELPTIIDDAGRCEAASEAVEEHLRALRYLS